MARKVQVILEDDLDGTELGTNGETVTFGLDGTTYEIDLSDKNAAALRDAFGMYVQHARKAGRVGSGHTTRRGTTGGSSHGSGETKQARAWLIEHGFLSADSRGRISQDNWDRYHQRHQMTTAEAEQAAGDVPAETAAMTAAEPSSEGQSATDATGETAETPSKPPRRNSRKADQAEAGTETTPSTDGLASLLP